MVIVAIDGGAATGKSSTAGALSERFNLLHVDTGGFYRTVTVALLDAGVNPHDEAAAAEVLPRLNLSTGIQERRAFMQLDGRDPGDRIRSPAVNENVSFFSAQPAIREFLLSYQRGQTDVARRRGFPGIVMEGRDIGSVIFPDAEFRFFLAANEAERLRRRALQGETDEIGRRDRIDSERKIAPLVCPRGAIAINTTAITLNEVVETISRIIERKLPRLR